MICRLVAIVKCNYRDDEEYLIEKFFRKSENAERWIENNIDEYHSFHYVLLLCEDDKECEDDDLDEEEEE